MFIAKGDLIFAIFVLGTACSKILEDLLMRVLVMDFTYIVACIDVVIKEPCCFQKKSKKQKVNKIG